MRKWANGDCEDSNKKAFLARLALSQQSCCGRMLNLPETYLSAWNCNTLKDHRDSRSLTLCPGVLKV